MPRMNAKYTRPIDEEVLNTILLTEPFRFLTHNVNAMISNDSNALTVQLLSRNRIAYHHGSQCVLTVTLLIKRGRPIIKCSANHDFKDARLHPECCAEYGYLMRNWAGTDTEDFQNTFKTYLNAVVPAVESRYYRGDDQGNKAEGYWTNLAYHRFGNEFSEKKPWLIIDRDFSLGFPHASEKKEFYSTHAKPYMEIKQRLQNENREKWGKPSKRAFRQEAGFLALNKNGELVAVELRRGSNTSGICWAPIAAAAHRDAIISALPNISESISTLVAQKVTLGLLPSAALDRIRNQEFKEVSAAVAIANPQPDDHTSWALLDESIEYTKAIKPELSIETAKIFNK